MRQEEDKARLLQEGTQPDRQMRHRCSTLAPHVPCFNQTLGYENLDSIKLKQGQLFPFVISLIMGFLGPFLFLIQSDSLPFRWCICAIGFNNYYNVCWGGWVKILPPVSLCPICYFVPLLCFSFLLD